MTTLPRFLPLPPGSFFLFGPRGTGKTTWLRTTLPDALVVDLLDPEEYRPRRAKRRLVAHPRFFYFDCGVFRSLRRQGPLDRPADIAGPALEGLVAQHLRAWIAYSASGARLHYWRTRAGSEVDFVLYGGDVFCAVDVMNADRIRPADLRGLAAFGRDYPEADRFLLHRGRERLLRSGVHCIPMEDFLLGLTPTASLKDAFHTVRREAGSETE